MKKIAILALALILTPVSLTKANYTLQPSLTRFYPGDIEGLDHYHFYIWKVNLSLPDTEIVTGANLFIKNINNFPVEENILYIRLLSNDDIQNADHYWSMEDPTVVDPNNSDVYRGWDNKLGGDNLSSYGDLLTTFTDDDVDPNLVEDFSCTFNPYQVSLLNGYITSDSAFGIGFDPDCHYFNEGLTLTIKTNIIPAPGAILLAGIGAGTIGWLRRRQILH